MLLLLMYQYMGKEQAENSQQMEGRNTYERLSNI